MQASGFLLAGGQSSRMGQNKALLRFGDQTLAEIALQKLAAVCPQVAIAGGDPALATYGRLIPDQHPNNGPLGGIVAALEQTETEWNLFLPVDVPLLPVEGLQQLLSHAASPSTAVLAESAGRVHPLCAVISRQTLPILRQKLESNQLRVRAALEAAGPVTLVPFEQEHWFQNLNTPEEFQQARAKLLTHH